MPPSEKKERKEIAFTSRIKAKLIKTFPVVKISVKSSLNFPQGKYYKFLHVSRIINKESVSYIASSKTTNNTCCKIIARV